MGFSEGAASRDEPDCGLAGDASEEATQWDLIRDPAHVVMRYAPAIRRHFHVLIRNEHDAEEAAPGVLSAHYPGRFFASAQERGRFRDYLRRAVRNAALNALRDRRGPKSGLFRLPVDAMAEHCPLVEDQEWLAGWRRCLLKRAFRVLARHEQCSPANRCHTVLRAIAKYPDADCRTLAAHVSRSTGRPLNAVAFRKQPAEAAGCWHSAWLMRWRGPWTTQRASKCSRNWSTWDSGNWCGLSCPRRKRDSPGRASPVRHFFPSTRVTNCPFTCIHISTRLSSWGAPAETNSTIPPCGGSPGVRGILHHLRTLRGLGFDLGHDGKPPVNDFHPVIRGSWRCWAAGHCPVPVLLRPTMPRLWLRTLVRHLSGPRSGGQKSLRPRKIGMVVERLEDRLTPSAELAGAVRPPTWLLGTGLPASSCA